MLHNTTQNEKRIVITGVGTINPIGSTVEEYWDNLMLGKSGVRRVQHFPTDDYFVKIAGEVDIPDNASRYFAPDKKRQMRRLDPYIIYTYIAATQALQDSGLEIDTAPERYGSLVGTGDGGVGSHASNITKVAAKGMQAGSPFYIINAIPSSGAGFFSQCWNLQGVCFSINSACASSNHSIGLAAMMIRSGIADAIFAGGAEASVNVGGMAAFGNIHALSERNDSPETASRPFEADRDGFVISEGAGIVCVEDLEHARRRGARIYCELTGFGFSCDAHDFVAPHPQGRGASDAIKYALASAKLNTEDIDLINAHATSTPLGDMVEYLAIRNVFGRATTKVPINSTKSMTGHLLGASGGIEAIDIIQTIMQGVAHPTINLFRQDPDIDLNIIKDEPLESKFDHVISDGFGFGGQNAALVLSRFKS